MDSKEILQIDEEIKNGKPAADILNASLTRMRKETENSEI